MPRLSDWVQPASRYQFLMARARRAPTVMIRRRRSTFSRFPNIYAPGSAACKPANVAIYVSFHPFGTKRESGDQNIYLVMDDLGRLGRIWPEADAETTDLETVISDLLTGQYSSPVRVVAFNTAERWSEDVSADVAEELRRQCDLQMRELPSTISDFV
jgi:hypothetical protein